MEDALMPALTAKFGKVVAYPRGYIVEPWIADTAGFAEIDFVRGAASFIVTSGPKFLSGANVTPHHGVAFIETSWRARVL